MVERPDRSTVTDKKSGLHSEIDNVTSDNRNPDSTNNTEGDAALGSASESQTESQIGSNSSSRARWQTIARVFIAPIVLPHELAHAAVAVLVGLNPVIRILPQWSGTTVPLGQFDAEIDTSTPTWAIQAVAAAPLAVYLTVAALVGTFISINTAVVLPIILLLSFSASLSTGDIAIISNPAEARQAGAFVVQGSTWQNITIITTPVTTAVVAILLI